MPSVSVSLVPGFAPLDAQFGQDDKRFFPAALASRFAGPAPLHVLLDGAKIANLPELLDASGLPHLCLFDGGLSALADAAPWLVTLTPHHRLTRALFTAQGTPQLALWPKAVALFIETDLALPDLRKHFRRFLRVADGSGQMYFFRFWEAATCVAYFQSVGDDGDLVARWFRPRDGGRITALLVPDVAGHALQVVEPRDLPAQPEPPTGSFVLRDTDHAAMARARLEIDLKAMTQLLAVTFPEKTKGSEPAQTDLLARRTVSRMHAYGFSQQDHLFTLLAWELHFGPFFETRDPDGHLRRICESALDANEKFALLSDRMATFD